MDSMCSCEGTWEFKQGYRDPCSTANSPLTSIELRDLLLVQHPGARDEVNQSRLSPDSVSCWHLKLLKNQSNRCLTEEAILQQLRLLVHKFCNQWSNCRIFPSQRVHLRTQSLFGRPNSLSVFQPMKLFYHRLRACTHKFCNLENNKGTVFSEGPFV